MRDCALLYECRVRVAHHDAAMIMCLIWSLYLQHTCTHANTPLTHLSDKVNFSVRALVRFGVDTRTNTTILPSEMGLFATVHACVV
jgi:hypothetical protein